MDHDSREFFQELFRDFSVVGENFPVKPDCGQPPWNRRYSMGLPVIHLHYLFYSRESPKGKITG